MTKQRFGQKNSTAGITTMLTARISYDEKYVKSLFHLEIKIAFSSKICYNIYIEILAEWNDIRLEVQRVYYARFVARHLEELVLPLDTTIETLNAVIELFSKPDAKNKVYYYTEDIITTPTQEYDKNKDPILVEPETLKVYYLYYYNGHYLVPVGPGQTQFTDEFGSRVDEEGNVIQTYAGKDLILLTSAQAKYAERYAEGLWNSLTPYYV